MGATPISDVVAHEGRSSRPSSIPSARATRAVRFAVFLTGGLVTLAFGVQVFASALGQTLKCAYRTPFCQNGFTPAETLTVVPLLAGGAFLIVVAAVLFLLAHRNHG